MASQAYVYHMALNVYSMLTIIMHAAQFASHIHKHTHIRKHKAEYSAQCGFVMYGSEHYGLGVF